jgi:hypothetical protein
MVAALCAAACALVLAAVAPGVRIASAQNAEPDSVSDLFRQLADSTDASYGEASVAYDTTGLDSLSAYDFGDLPPPKEQRRRAGRLSISPILGYHRTEGVVLGAGATVGGLTAGVFHAEGSFGFENQGGRYAFRWRKPLFIGGDLSRYRRLAEPRLIERRRQLDLFLEYARTTEQFMPEHARPRAGSARAILFGRDQQSVYESRGFRGGLTWWAGDVRMIAGWEEQKERAMPLETRWSVFGDRDSVPDNLAATPDDYGAPFGGVAFMRTDWDLMARVDGRGGGEDRWRLRGAIGKGVNLGSSLKAYAQAEYGAVAFGAPAQRLFSVGGPRLLRTVRTGVTNADHLLGGKIDFVASMDLLRSIGLGGPDWLVLNPWVITEAAAIWDDDRSVVFSNPPSQAWRGAAGGGVVFRPGVPDPDVWLRFGYIARVGRGPGQSHFTISLDRAFDLLGKL